MRLARQHKSQFAELIEAARKNRARLRKPESTVQSTVEEVRDDRTALKPSVPSGVMDTRDEGEYAELDNDGRSSTSSSVELVTDTELLTAVNQPLTGNLILMLRHVQSEQTQLISFCRLGNEIN